MKAFSERSAVNVGPNALTQALEEHRAHGRPLLNLAESNPTQVGLTWPGQELSALLAQPGASTYRPEPFGLLDARSALSAQLAHSGLVVPAEHLLLTASTSEAYGYLFKLLCDAGDNVLVPSPSYPLFDMLAAFEGVELVPYRLAYDGDWHLDMASLRSARNERTRAILLVHPNNPTGSYLKRSELDQLAEVGLPLISDEVFAEYALRDDPSRASSALEVGHRALVFRMGGLSKSLVLPQLKLAWTAIAGPTVLAREACERLTHIADTYLSVSTPIQLALPTLLSHGEAARARVQARVRGNLALLREQLVNSAASVLDVEGGWYAIVRLPAVQLDEEWAIRFLHEEQVLVQPGYFYDLTQGVHVVLSLICEPTTFADGVARLARCVARESAR